MRKRSQFPLLLFPEFLSALIDFPPYYFSLYKRVHCFSSCVFTLLLQRSDYGFSALEFRSI